MAKETSTKQKVQKDETDSKSKTSKKVAKEPKETKEVVAEPVAEPKPAKGKKAAVVEEPVAATVTKKADKKADKKAAPKAKAVKKGGAKPKDDEEPEEGDGKKKNRSFKSIYVGPDGEVVQEGRYCGIKPKQAACKALTGIFKTFKLANKKSPSEIKFGVVETTRHSKHKKYWYTGGRVKLDAPVEVTIKRGSKENKIVYKFNNVVKKITEDECENLSNCNPREVQAAGAKKGDDKPKAPKTKSAAKKEADVVPAKAAKGKGTKAATPAKEEKPAKAAAKKTK
jgi:hypothetical protein